MINDPQQGRFGIHWSQQVGPSCGIQAIRFAIDILLPELKVEQPDMLPSFQLIHDNNQVAIAVADPSPPSASTTFVNEQEMSHNFLQEAIQLEYTTEGAIYNLHHIVDLIQRYSCSASHNHSLIHIYLHKFA